MVAAETDANNQQAVERMSVIMRTHRQYLDDTALLYQNLPSCNCCPYGYHIDLDFVRYCESLVNAEPSDGQLLRRDRRRSRKSLEVMLGLEDFYQWDPTIKVQTVQEVHHEVEPESPRVAIQIPPSYSCYTYDDDSQTASRPKTTNSSPETSAFLRDALDDVVSDFERTLERTKKKDRKYREIPDDPLLTWGPYFDMIDSCVSGDGNQEKHDAFKPSLPTSPVRPIPAVLLQEKEEVESLGSNGSEMSTRALFNIREQMAISLNRMKDLEEQVKSIPALQRQLTTLKEEKRQLQQQLKKDDSAKISSPATVTTGTSTGRASNAQFTPQRISPVALGSLGSRILPDPPESAKKVLRRDVGVMCTQHTRDVGTLPSLPVVRSVGTNYASGNGILDELFTRTELDDLIKVSLKEYDLEKEVLRKKNHISIGTQMAPQPRIERNHISVQTIAEKPPIKMSQGIMVAPTCRDAITLCKPDYRTVGSSDHKITDLLCDRCLIPKRTVGCGPDPEATKSYLSLKSMDMPPRSLSFSLGENERLNIKRKTVGTQYQISMQHIGVQSSIPMDSIGIQHVPTSATKSCQYIADCLSKYSDTLDLVKLHDSGCNTDEIVEEKPKLPPPPPPRRTCDSFMNTDVIRLMDHWTNTNPPPRTRNTFSNTDTVHTKDASCGDIIKPHISISCADNYCDSCKDAIKNLAKEFSKVLGSPILGNGSRIPRPTTLSSPRPDRKKFVRQNTYTISTPTPSPLSEHRAISDTTIKTLFGSLDSVNSEKGPTGKLSSSSNECLTRNLEVSNTDRPPIPPVEQQQYKSQSVTLSTSQSLAKSPSPPLSPHAGTQSATSSFISESWIRNPSSSQRLNGDVTDQDAGECSQTESSQFENEQQLRNEEQLHQDMLLNQLATVTSEPRTKAEPSKEMRAALKVINDSLQKSTKSSNLKNANLIVQKEWFKVSSTNEAKPLDVEDYLDCFEEFSNAVLKYVVNMSDHNGNSAMHYAVSHGNFDVVSILLDSKVCDVNQTNNAGYTCIMLVSLAKLKNSAHRTVVQRLFQMADVNIRAKKHCQTALMLAVSHGNLDMVEMLLGAGADINIQDEDGSTALMCAAEHGRIDIVKYLLAQPDCDSLIQDIDGSTAFKIAWQAGHRDIGLLLYVHEQMLRSKMPARSDQRSQAHPRHQKHH